MLDPRLLARLVDPAALARTGSDSDSDSDAAADSDSTAAARAGALTLGADEAAALRPFLNAALPPLLSNEGGPEAPAAAGPVAGAVAGAVASETGSGAVHEALAAASILLPAGPPATGPRGLESLPDARATGWKAGAGAWEQGPALIEPLALWPAANPTAPAASRPEPLAPPAAAERFSDLDLDLDLDPDLDLPGARPRGSGWPNAPRDARPPADAWTGPGSGSGSGSGGGGALASLAPRLLQAAERLEAAAEQLARQAGRAASSSPRPFRGRVAD
jgi:hypothetical protein